MTGGKIERGGKVGGEGEGGKGGECRGREGRREGVKMFILLSRYSTWRERQTACTLQEIRPTGTLLY